MLAVRLQKRLELLLRVRRAFRAYERLHRMDDCRHSLVRLRVVFAGICRDFQKVHGFDEDELQAALGELYVVLDELIALTGQITCRARGGLDHAVAQLHLADLERGEQGLELLVSRAVIRALGIEVGGRDLFKRRKLRVGLLDRCLRRRGRCTQSAELADGRNAQGAGCRAFDEIPS